MAYLRGLGVYLPVAHMTSSEIAAASGLPEWVVRDKLGIHRKPVPGYHWGAAVLRWEEAVHRTATPTAVRNDAETEGTWS